MQSVNEEPLSKKSKVEPSTVTSEVSTAMTNKKKSSRGLKMKKLPERACAKEGDLLPPGHISYTVSHGEPSFATMRISSHEPLLKMDQRVKCPGCHSKRKYFCYRCYKILAPPNAVPQLTLPITVDIIHWPSELISKSTAIHAKLLAPTSVNIFEYPNFPDYNTEEVLLLYPTEDAIAVNDMDIETAKRIKRVVFVDSQWHAAHRILRHERLMKLTCVKFTAYKTFFWRYQQCGDECLATIEGNAQSLMTQNDFSIIFAEYQLSGSYFIWQRFIISSKSIISVFVVLTMVNTIISSSSSRFSIISYKTNTRKRPNRSPEFKITSKKIPVYSTFKDPLSKRLRKKLIVAIIPISEMNNSFFIITECSNTSRKFYVLGS
jgi:hypothetical protein